MEAYRNSDPAPPQIMAGSPPTLILPRIDWDRPPWNRWAFQHIREILPTVEVWRGHGHRRKLPRAERDLDALLVTDSEGQQTTLAGLLDETYTDGFLVIKDGAVVYERYFNGMSERSLHLSQSMAKSVTGMTFGVLAGRGVVDPARLVTDYLPELATTGWAGARVQHVLDMTPAFASRKSMLTTTRISARSTSPRGGNQYRQAPIPGFAGRRMCGSSSYS